MVNARSDGRVRPARDPLTVPSYQLTPPVPPAGFFYVRPFKPIPPVCFGMACRRKLAMRRAVRLSEGG
jgi:hypothetical protein